MKDYEKYVFFYFIQQLTATTEVVWGTKCKIFTTSWHKMTVMYYKKPAKYTEKFANVLFGNLVPS